MSGVMNMGHKIIKDAGQSLDGSLLIESVKMRLRRARRTVRHRIERRQIREKISFDELLHEFAMELGP